MAYEKHQQSANDIRARCAVITLSDTRTEATDKGGARIKQLLVEQGHEVVEYQIIPDDPAKFELLLETFLVRADIDAVVTTGGTGLSRRDQTIDVVQRIIEQPIPGFGELFRMLSYEQIGSGALLSRAMAGVSRGKLIFALPGSVKAIELAMSKLILPEIRHILFELRK